MGRATRARTAMAAVAAVAAVSVALVSLTPLGATAAGPTYSVSARIPIGSPSAELAVDSSAQRVYAVRIGRVEVIDTATASSIGSFTAGSDPTDIAVDPSTGLVYVLDRPGAGNLPGRLAVVDPGTFTVQDTAEVGANPQAVAVDPSVGRAFVVAGYNRVWVVDTATHQVMTTVPTVGAGVADVAVDTALHRAYVANNRDDSVSVLDTRSLQVLGTIGVGSAPARVAVDSVAHRAYVTDYSGSPGSVTVIDTTRDAVIGTLGVGAQPLPVGVDPGAHRVFVGNSEDGTVSVIDTSQGVGIVVDTVEGLGYPRALAVDDVRHAVYVSDGDDASIVRITAGTTSQTVDIGSTPPRRAHPGSSYSAKATGGASGNPVAFSVDPSSTPSACTVTPAGRVSFARIGTCVVAADQAGDDSYEPAPTATQSITVFGRRQKIRFSTSLPRRPRVGSSYLLEATGGRSGNPVTFAVDPVSTPGACTLAERATASGGSGRVTVSFTGTGTCVVDADQRGDGTVYDDAPRRQRTITIG